MTTESRAGPQVGELRRRLQTALGERYVLEEVLGAGGTGTVFRALDRKHDRRVALKVLRPEFVASVGAERFLREIRIAAQLNHPHVVPVHDSGEADGLHYCVMALMEAESLQSLLDRGGRRPVDEAVRIALEIADALSYAHGHGIVHRDVKPGNILLSGGHALLADFGVARPVTDLGETLTVTGLAVGTPAYMSPEQLTGSGPVDQRSDVYSLACVLYEMLGGQRPFRTGSRGSLAGRFVSGPRPLQELRPDVPQSLAAAVSRALAPDPGERFQSAAAFAEALRVRAPARASGRRIAAVIAVAVLAAVALLDPFGLRGRPDLSDGSGSVVVLPFGDATQTPEEVRMLVDLAHELTRQLNSWDSIRAVPQVSLAGITFDLGLRRPVLEDLEDGLRTARALRVETLIALNARIRGDSVTVTATRFDVRSERQAGSPLESRGPVDDPFRLAAGIVHGVLGLTGPVEALEELRRRSSSPVALQRHDEGIALMERWRLTEAERALREAVALDSTFALAHHHLALVLYWQAADGTAAYERLGPEAVRLSRAALRHVDGLAGRELDHVVALNRFLEGDLEAARNGYGSLLARDSTDVYAWLLTGIVEYRDRWLETGRDGSLRPRSDLNAAIRAFTETVRLNPGFHLGYGHLFDITGAVIGAAQAESMQGYERPRDEIVPPWEAAMDPSSLEAFGLIYDDSLVWLDEPAFAATPRERKLAGARSLLEMSLRALRRWAAFAPDEHRPHAELATWTVQHRKLLPSPQPPERLDSLARVALEHAERGLALLPDSTPEDLVRLGNLLLAAGQTERARSIVILALERSPSASTLPRSAPHVFLFGGDVDRALEVLRREPRRYRYWEEPGTGRMLDDGGQGPAIRRIAVLGATGADDRLAEAFAGLEAAWRTPSSSRLPLDRLLAAYAPEIAVALAARPDVLVRWRTEGGLEDPLWEAVDPGAADRAGALRRALAAPVREVEDPDRSYLLGAAALDVGDPALALRLFARLDSMALELGVLEVGWGLRALSLYRRGEAHERLGEHDLAARSYRAFLETRHPSAAGSPLEAEARLRLEGLTTGSTAPTTPRQSAGETPHQSRGGQHGLYEMPRRILGLRAR